MLSVEKIKTMNIGMKHRLPGATSLIPPSTSPELTLHILIIRTDLLESLVSSVPCPQNPCVLGTQVRGSVLQEAAPLPVQGCWAPRPAVTPECTNHTHLAPSPESC